MSKIKFSNSYLKLDKCLYSHELPEKCLNPELFIWNINLAKEFQLDWLTENEIRNYFSGNSIFEGSEPIAQAYCGHQFGRFNILGDGRALLLGEIFNNNSERFDLQLKGSGRTAYSRGGDGKAAIGPMLREYLISEFMSAMNTPTSRSLCVIKTNETVQRETSLSGAVLTRIAKSHIRVGTFEYVSFIQDTKLLKAFADYCLDRHFPNCLKSENPYLQFLKEVINVQCELISQWMAVGFIHGVMNTDNMTISGETIDYGPCAFMNEFNLDTVFSSIDIQGRYSYGNQPLILQWNLARLAECLLPLLNIEREVAIKIAVEEIEKVPDLYKEKYLKIMGLKLGINSFLLDDELLVKDWLNILEIHKLDYTNSFLNLTYEISFSDKIESDEAFKQWKSKWSTRLKKQDTFNYRNLMKKYNPVVVPRNHLVEKALSGAEKGDLNFFNLFLDRLTHPFDNFDSLVNTELTQVPLSDPCYKTYCGT